MEQAVRVRRSAKWSSTSITIRGAVFGLLLGVTFCAPAGVVVDATFNPPSYYSGQIAIKALSDGKVMVVAMMPGLIPTYTRLNSNGSEDGTYHAGSFSFASVDVATILADGRTIIAGNSLMIDGVNHGSVVRFLADGTVDPSFSGPTASSRLSFKAVRVDGNGRVYLSGSSLQTLDGQPGQYVARLNATGSVDTGFNPESGFSYFSTFNLFPNGDLLIAGTAASSAEVVRIAPDNSVVLTFGTSANVIAQNNSVVMVDITGRPIMASTMIGPAFTFTNSVIRLMPNGVIDPGFQPRTVSPQGYEVITADRFGRYYLGGDFTTYDGIQRSHLMRIFPDGSLDESFEADCNNRVTQLDMTAAGELLVGGYFTQIKGASAVGLARLFVGDLDAARAFQLVNTNLFEYDSAGLISVPVMRVGPTNLAATVDFGTSAGSAVPGIDYVETAGTLGFAAGEDLKYVSITIPRNSEIGSGSDFHVSLSNPSVGSALSSRNTGRITLLESDSTVSMESGDVVVSEGSGGVSVRLARIGSQTVTGLRLSGHDGTAVSGEHYRLSSLSVRFREGEVAKDVPVQIIDDPIENPDRDFTLQADEVEGGTIGGSAAAKVTIVDNDFDEFPGLGFSFWTNAYARGLQSLARDSRGRLIAGGGFSGVNGSPANNVARLLPSGEVDPSFQPGAGANDAIYSVAVDSSDRILIAGSFTAFNGVPAGRIARLLPDGTLDPSFDVGTGFDGFVERVEIEPDGRILAGGLFAHFNGQTRLAVALLNDSDVLDETFVPDSGISLYSNYFCHGAFLSPDGIIVVGEAQTYGTNGVFRLSLSGQRDPGFSVSIGPPMFTGFVTGVAVQPDGKLLIVGSFSEIDGVTRNNLARINSDGSLDGTFDPGSGADGWIYRVYGQPDGKFILVGFFEKYNGVARQYVARINPDGSLDTSFKPTTGPNENVAAALFNQDGSITLGGGFLRFDTIRRVGLATVDADGGLELTVPRFLSADAVGGKLNLSAVVEPDVDVRLLQSTALNGWSPVITNRTYKRVIQFAPDMNDNGNGFFQAERLGP